MREGDERVQSGEEEEEWAAIFTALYREPLWHTAIHLNTVQTLRHWESADTLFVFARSLSLLTLFTASWSLHTMHATGLKLLLRCSLISLPIHLLSLLWLYSQRSLLLHVCLFCPCPHCFIFFTVFICRLFAEVNVFDSSLCLVIIYNLC